MKMYLKAIAHILKWICIFTVWYASISFAVKIMSGYSTLLFLLGITIVILSTFTLFYLIVKSLKSLLKIKTK